MAKRQAGYDVRPLSQSRALSSPLRQEIVDALESQGASTIAAIAERLGRRPDALYFHFRALERIGLLRRTGTVGTGRSEAAVFDLPGRPLRLVYGATAAERQRRVGPALDSLLRIARRDARRALARDGVEVSGARRELWVARARGWLTPVQLARVNALLSELFELLHSAPPRDGAKPLALAFALTPLPNTPTGRKTARQTKGGVR